MYVAISCIGAYHLVMSTPAHGYVAELGRALERRGRPMTSEDFLAVLQEIGGQSEPLTSGERSFLLEHTELTESDLTDDARAETRLQVLQGKAAAEAETDRSALSTGEVAALLGRAEANVRRSRLNGDLYAAAVDSGRPLRFPRWQFTPDGHVVPGLREIVPRLPRHFHPLSIERFMTAPHEGLDGLAPAQWLSSGGPVQAVVDLAAEAGYE